MFSSCKLLALLDSASALGACERFVVRSTPMIQGVPLLRDELQKKRKALSKSFLETLDSRVYLREHSWLIDDLLRRLGEESLPGERVCVIATAGYGRREQFPQSDVDLLVVHDLDFREAETRIAPFLNSLWDSRLLLGQQVWSLEQFDQLSMEDFEFILAMFNSRRVWGSEELSDEILQHRLSRFVEEHRDLLLERIVEITRNRHERYSHTIFQLEPDLKEAPGCLRDHLAGTWLDRLLEKEIQLPDSRDTIDKAHRFLQTLRILLHLAHGRTDNRLTHEMQEAIQERLDYESDSTQRGVESLMSEFFVNARIISGFCSSLLHAAVPTDGDDPLPLQELPSMDSPRVVLEVFRHSLEQERPLAVEARNEVRNSLELFEDLDSPGLRDQVIDLVFPRPGVYRTLSEMYHLGVLEELFPEFKNIRARVIRDFYHKYTVDEHTLIAIKSVEDLVTGESNPDARFAAILHDTVNPSHLILALLFHDVGKGQGDTHTEESAQLAARALRRFRFERKEIETITFLIRHHLAMSGLVFRRDLEDEAVIRRFSNLVEDPEKLRLLTLLTYADIKAVAPGTLNEWKRDLLWQLYLDTYRKLTLQYGEERLREEELVGAKLLERLPPDVDRIDFEKFLEGFPTRYLLQTPAPEVYEHFRMSRRISAEQPVETHIAKRKTFYELAVVTPDRSRLFAKIVGLLSYFEMNILRGFGFANRRQEILDIFQFTDESNIFRLRAEKERFQDLLKKAVQGEVSVRKLLKGKERSVLFQKPGRQFEPSVYFEDEYARDYSIMEIVAPDALGLLYRISEEIARVDCEIDLALISTEGDKAVDVFYLRHRGGKLPSELKQRLKKEIQSSISEESPVTNGQV